MCNYVFFNKLGFVPKESASDIFIKKYSDGYVIEVDFAKKSINYGDKIQFDNATTQNFSQPENFVVLECVNRLLEKGYKPENIILEKTWGAGHGTSGRLDICVTRDDGSEYLLIECKTYGKEFDKEFSRMKKDGGQLFTYFKFSNKADVIMLYASELKGKEIIYRNEIVKIEDDYRTGDVKDFYEKWNKLTKDNGVFDSWVKPYNFESKALTINDLVEIKQEDSSFIFNQFLEILRHNVVSDKPNAFNKIFTLFLCKIYDEKINEDTDNELGFQWLEGVDDDISFQLRLTDLYKNGMLEFLEKKVTDFSEDEFDTKFKRLFAFDDKLSKDLKYEINRIRLEKNNEFAIKEVYDKKSFNENAKVVKEIVELLQKFKIRYAKKQQYLSDFFEMLLTTGLKQESGQFFTPVPIAQFILKSLPVNKFVEEKLQAGKKDELLPYIIDYAAGSGHFITESMHEIQRLLNKIDKSKLKPEARSFVEIWRIRHFDWALQYIYGIEKDYRLVKVGKVGCYLHGDGLANVIHCDGLASFDYQEYKGKLNHNDEKFPKENKQFEIVISNPPYSVSAFKNTSTEYYSKNDFELYDSLTDNSSEIECLFVERTKQLLKDGGIAGVILPSSILSNEGIYTKAREIILKYFEIIAITELGSNTFMATGTNTVVLFLKRRNNYESINFKESVERFFVNFQDVTINGIEKPIAKYVNHVWQTISFDDYLSLLKNSPNENIENHEFYKNYKKSVEQKIDSEIVRQKKNRKTALSVDDKKKIGERIEKECFNDLIETEKEKLLYFILAYPQKTVLVKTGEKDAEKRFLGYEFSNRRGSEGIHPIQRGKAISECTKLFDEEKFDNEEKASTYIYKAFSNDYDFPIHESLKNNISCVRLVDMITFDREKFEKIIFTTVKKKVEIKSKWDLVRLGEIEQLEFINGYAFKSSDFKHHITSKSDLPVLKIANIANNSTDFANAEYHDTKGFDAKIVNQGDIAIALTGATVGKAGKITEKCLLNQRVLAIKNNDIVKFVSLFVFGNDFYDYAQNIAHGNAQGNLSPDEVKAFQIPLPPKEIQEKIVAEIEVLEKKEAEAKEKVEKLKKNIDNILENKSVEKYKIGDILTLEYGAGLTENDRVQGEYPVMGSNGIVGYHNDYLIESPSIIVGRKGSAGKVTWIDKNCYPIDTTFYVKLVDNQYNMKLIYYTLQKLNLESLSGGTGVPGLNRNDAYSKEISLPPLSEQQKIVSEIEKIETQIAELEQELTEIPKEKENVLKKYL